MSPHVSSLLVIMCTSYGSACDVRARTTGGWVCGVRGTTPSTPFASFLGVPYAQQPLGELRFKELQPVQPWDNYYDATEDGPICPQHDVLYGPLMINRNMSESCIHANVHVPLDSLPGYEVQSSEEYQSPYNTGLTEEEDTGLPIIVFVHGGGFSFGSGSTDLHGPENFIDKGSIVITFNYRLNVFGFMSLNSSSIPGNNGLRDMIVLLEWVKENAKFFGGDPNQITLAGQSAGAASVHLLSLSPAAEGLFQRAILMSGTAISGFFTTSPNYATYIANAFLTFTGINETDPEEIHRQLVKMPIENIMEANRKVQELNGISAFMPVLESPHENVRQVIDTDPEVLISKGCGKSIPLIIGFTSKECETFRRAFEDIDLLERIKTNPIIILPIDIIYKTDPNIILDTVKKYQNRYFNGEPNLDEYVESCDDAFYKYPAVKLARMRERTNDGAPVYLYEFSYNADRSAIKESMNLQFDGAGHIEDLTFIFNPQYLMNVSDTHRSKQDNDMVTWMTSLFSNFMYYNDPTCNQNKPNIWPAVKSYPPKYLDIVKPKYYHIVELTRNQQNMIKFFDSLQPRDG